MDSDTFKVALCSVRAVEIGESDAPLLPSPFEFAASGFASSLAPDTSHREYRDIIVPSDKESHAESQEQRRFGTHSERSSLKNEDFDEKAKEFLRKKSHNNGGRHANCTHGTLSDDEMAASAEKRSNKSTVIAVFGATGAGKSTFISKLTNKTEGIGHGLNSFTATVEEHEVQVGENSITLLDTPGFHDTNLSDTHVLVRITSWMEEAYEKGTPLAGVIYVHRINDPRMPGTALKNIRLLKSMCGSNNLNHVRLVSTMWDKEEYGVAERREQELLHSENFWGALRSFGAVAHRYDNTPESAIQIVGELALLRAVTLKLQHEVAVEKKQLGETAAGQVVSQDIDNQMKKYNGNFKHLKEQLEQARQRNKDNALLVAEKERERIERRMRSWEADLASFRLPISRRRRRRHYVVVCSNVSIWYCVECEEPLEKVQDADLSPIGKCPGCGTRQVFRP